MKAEIPTFNSRDNVDDIGRNKLHYAANNGIVPRVKALLDEGIDINAQDNIGWTALHFAAQNNHFKTIEILLEYNANPNIHDKQGNGPLWTASMHAKDDLSGVLSLLRANADPSHQNTHGRSPEYLANTKKNGLLELFAEHEKTRAAAPQKNVAP